VDSSILKELARGLGLVGPLFYWWNTAQRITVDLQFSDIYWALYNTEGHGLTY